MNHNLSRSDSFGSETSCFSYLNLDEDTDFIPYEQLDQLLLDLHSDSLQIRLESFQKIQSFSIDEVATSSNWNKFLECCKDTLILTSKSAHSSVAPKLKDVVNKHLLRYHDSAELISGEICEMYIKYLVERSIGPKMVTSSRKGTTDVFRIGSEECKDFIKEIKMCVHFLKCLIKNWMYMQQSTYESIFHYLFQLLRRPISNDLYGRDFFALVDCQASWFSAFLWNHDTRSILVKELSSSFLLRLYHDITQLQLPTSNPSTITTQITHSQLSRLLLIQGISILGSILLFEEIDSLFPLTLKNGTKVTQTDVVKKILGVFQVAKKQKDTQLCDSIRCSFEDFSFIHFNNCYLFKDKEILEKVVSEFLSGDDLSFSTFYGFLKRLCNKQEGRTYLLYALNKYEKKLIQLTTHDSIHWEQLSWILRQILQSASSIKLLSNCIKDIATFEDMIVPICCTTRGVELLAFSGKQFFVSPSEYHARLAASLLTTYKQPAPMEPVLEERQSELYWSLVDTDSLVLFLMGDNKALVELLSDLVQYAISQWDIYLRMKLFVISLLERSNNNFRFITDDIYHIGLWIINLLCSNLDIVCDLESSWNITTRLEEYLFQNRQLTDSNTTIARELLMRCNTIGGTNANDTNLMELESVNGFLGSDKSLWTIHLADQFYCSLKLDSISICESSRSIDICASGIEIIISYARTLNIKVTEDQLRLLLGQYPSETFDWFLSSLFLFFFGDTQRVQAVIQQKSFKLLWRNRRTINDTFEFGKQLEEKMQEHIPCVYNSFVLSGLSCVKIPLLWIDQMFLNVLKWRDIVKIIIICITHGDDYLIDIIISIFESMEHDIVRQTTHGNLLHFLLNSTVCYNISDFIKLKKI